MDPAAAQADTVARSLEAAWPGDIRGIRLDALQNLTLQRRQELGARLMAALPSSPNAAEQVRRLRDLHVVLTEIGPAASEDLLRALLYRYREWANEYGDDERVAAALEAIAGHLSLASPVRWPAVPAADPEEVRVQQEPINIGSAMPDRLEEHRVVPPLTGSKHISAKGSGGEQRTRSLRHFGEQTERSASASPGEAEQEDEQHFETPGGMLLGNTAGEIDAETIQQLRRWRADVEDLGENQPLSVGDQYTVAVSVDTHVAGAAATEVFDEQLLAGQSETDVFSLTVMVTSSDFDILSDTVRPLRVPRKGRSLGRARFDVSPVREGSGLLTATVDLNGNFLTQLELRLPVGVGAPRPTLTAVGRPPESAATLEPREISLILKRAPGGGYDCIAIAGQHTEIHLPITDVELSYAVGQLREAVLDVVKSPDSSGALIFQTGTEIPEDASAAALRTLARAGARVFQQLFLHAKAGADARTLGEWIRAEATRPHVRLNVQFVAADMPVPWSLLYLGDASAGADLDWKYFLGLRHVVEQIPYQARLTAQDSRIMSVPRLSVALNVNSTIDQQFRVTLVSEHERRWQALAGQRHGVNVSTRRTKADVVTALSDAATGDQILYFYCHATASGPDGNPDDAALVMGLPADAVTVKELNLDASTQVQLTGHPLVFINACESAELSPLFYAGFVPYFMAKGARGVIGTEAKTPVLFAIRFAEAFFDRLLDGKSVGEALLTTRQAFMERDRNPLGLLYAGHCDGDVRIDPALSASAGESVETVETQVAGRP